MNKELMAGRFAKAINTYTREASVQQQIAEQMTTLLKQCLTPSFGRKIIEFGCGTGTYSRMLLRWLQPQHLLLNDICGEMKTCCSDCLNEQVSFVAGDAETLLFPKGIDLITSCSTLQWFENPEKFFLHCNDILTPNGYIAITTFGKENMKEIRTLTGYGLNYHSLEELKSMLTPWYEIVYAKEEMIVPTFGSPMQVLVHLKETGVTGTCQYYWTRKRLADFCTDYTSLFSKQSGDVTLTYHPIYIIAKKRT